MYRTKLQIKLSHMHGRLARLACSLSGFDMWSFNASDVFLSVSEVATATLPTVLDIHGLKLEAIFDCVERITVLQQKSASVFKFLLNFLFISVSS